MSHCIKCRYSPQQARTSEISYNFAIFIQKTAEKLNTPSSGKKLYHRLLRHVVPYWRIFGLSVLSTIVYAITEPAIPALLKPLLDGSFVHKNPSLLHLIPIVLISLFLVRGIASFLSSYSLGWIASRLVMDLRNLMFHQLLRLPSSYHDEHSSGELIADIAFNVNQVTDAGTSAVSILVRDSFTIIGLLAWMLYLNWKLTLITFAVIPLIYLVVRQASARLRSMSLKTQSNLGDLTHILEEAIAGQKVVKIFGGENREYERFVEASNWSRRFTMKRLAASAANVPIVQIISAIALSGIIYVATKQAIDNHTTVGGFVSFITAMLLLFSPIKRLTSVNDTLQRGLAAAQTIFTLLDASPEKDTGYLQPKQIQGALQFKNISIHYPGTHTPALNKLNLEIKAGETIALVGPSGSGKTTLVNLIPRFYIPEEGDVFLDGVHLNDITLTHLRSHIAMVSQDIVLFNDTIHNNIAYGGQINASTEEVIKAARMANAEEFILQLPQGYNTLAGENGAKLSGGQRQRIAIARALLKNAPILILDEATSALDMVSERQVQTALDLLMKQRTTLVIAHRLSTIEKADRIIVLQNGQIVETGTHQDLLDRHGIYAHLYQVQLAHSSME
ncbi:MAG: lipid A export permease/ATP-binding protein MsbA [Proteobacteria bacterium]|nr:lipid A export permease/ATP-binding protein MsbA [Pseudomonadota bacterium]MDE3208916.1 lipid A export permease/ATP-binding protein MsbA [Pseudomonadota bacterium]